MVDAAYAELPQADEEERGLQRAAEPEVEELGGHAYDWRAEAAAAGYVTTTAAAEADAGQGNRSAAGQSSYDIADGYEALVADTYSQLHALAERTAQRNAGLLQPRPLGLEPEADVPKPLERTPTKVLKVKDAGPTEDVSAVAAELGERLGRLKGEFADLCGELEGKRAVETARAEDVREARERAEALLALLRAEEKAKLAAEERVRELEHAALEQQTAAAVAAETSAAEAAKLRARCRRLESESDMAELFDNFEREIQHAQAEAASLRRENQELHRRVAAAEDAKFAAAAAHLSPSADAKRLQAVRNALRKAESERETAQAEVASLRKRDRHHAALLASREATQRRLNALERDLSQREHEGIARGLQAAESDAKAFRAVEEARNAVRESDEAKDEAAALRVELENTREELFTVRKQLRQEQQLVSSRLAKAAGQSPAGPTPFRARSAVPSSAVSVATAPPPSAMASASRAERAAGLAQALRQHLPSTPQADTLFDRLVRETQASVDEHRVMMDREDALLRLQPEPKPGQTRRAPPPLRRAAVAGPHR